MLNFTRRQWLTLIVIGIADFCNAICVSLQAPFYPAEVSFYRRFAKSFVTKMVYKPLSKRQVFTLLAIGAADFASGMCCSLQAPFFPKEAERKGCTATEYGLVFGIFEFVVFIVSPLYGQHLNKIGPKITFNGGIYTTGICAILFGLLDKVEGHIPFITLSFVIRIVEAMGNAAFLTASFAIIAKEFPDKIALTFASLETFFGLGLIVGPTVGGALFQVGGYTLPFAVMGSTLFASAILTAIVLPKHETGRDKEKGPSVFKILKIPGILLASASIIVTSTSISFLQATLEPHLRTFNLAPVVLGLMFVINGGVYAITTPLWGWACDNFVYGFHNDLETYALVSGLWTSTFALGAFIGPSIAGILYDTVGFRNASMFIVVIHLLVGIGTVVFIFISRRPPVYVEIKDEKLSNGQLEATQSQQTQADDSVRRSISINGISVEKCRPPAMNSLIACNSYKSQAWPERDSFNLLMDRPYSHSYGAVNSRSSAPYLQGVA
ncbi:hypothetical protein HUJ05_003307 [Dendroctonus ponderosae]|nr:hypothetical protein HUJ05_003307 [Dendroctonus ponderosae]